MKKTNKIITTLIGLGMFMPGLAKFTPINSRFTPTNSDNYRDSWMLLTTNSLRPYLFGLYLP